MRCRLLIRAWLSWGVALSLLCLPGALPQANAAPPRRIHRLRADRANYQRVRLRQPLRHGRHRGKTHGLLYLGGGLAGRRQTRPVDALLSRMVAELVTSGQKITRGKVRELGIFAATSGGDTRPGRWALRQLLHKHADRFANADALADAKALLTQGDSSMPRPDNAVYAVKGAAGDHGTRNHELIIKRDGDVNASTGRRTYSRGWLQANQEPLLKNHGSPVPASRLLDEGRRAKLQALGPAERLDRAVKILTGRDKVGMTSFSEMAKNSVFAAKGQPDWSGQCYSWSHCALDSRLSKLVDVKGPKGQRGLWIAGQWLSRADLGNFLTATASAYAQGEGSVMHYNPEAQDLVKAALGYLMKGGKGFRADIGPALKNPSEVWFQPFTGAKVQVRAIPTEAKQRILSIAAQAQRNPATYLTTPGVQGVDVKLIKIRGRYGDEKGEGHEGPPAMATMQWNAYAVLDAQGKAKRILMANDPQLAQVAGLPTRQSSAVPRDLFVPDHWFVDALLAGKKHPSFQQSLYGPHVSFLIGTVLSRGVPGRTRAAFEAEAALRGSGKLPRQTARDLARRYPTVANAYTPEQWQQSFGTRGLPARAFGFVGTLSAPGGKP